MNNFDPTSHVKGNRFSPGFHLGSEGENGEHLRDISGWPYSIYRRDDRIGGCDFVICHGIQHREDADTLLQMMNAAIHN
jgi:hypothetical protein